MFSVEVCLHRKQVGNCERGKGGLCFYRRVEKVSFIEIGAETQLRVKRKNSPLNVEVTFYLELSSESDLVKPTVGDGEEGGWVPVEPPRIPGGVLRHFDVVIMLTL